MKLNIFLSICVLVIMCSGCQIISQNLDEMSEADYNRVQREIYLITKITCREIFRASPELKYKMGLAIDVIGPNIGEYVENGEFFDKLAENIDDPEIKELIELIMLEIGRYGGFKYIDQAKSMLDTRSIGIMTQAVFAIADAVGE